jgi:ferredoxin-NADP reductase
MKTIKRLTGVITKYKDLSPTAREITLKLSEPIDFTAGSFVNVFLEKEGKDCVAHFLLLRQRVSQTLFR